MVDTATSHYGLVKPENWASNDTWGVKLNSNFDATDNILFTIANQAANAAVLESIRTHPALPPIGSIIMFAGTPSSLPANWKVCDGSGGTPDLRGRFVLGVSPTITSGSFGGAASFTPTITDGGHNLTVLEMPWHNHGFSDPGHAHGVADPGHVHGDNGHTHGIPNGTASLSTLGLAGGGSVFTVPTSYGANTYTGYASIAANTTGIATYGSGTGISFSGQGGGGAHYHPITSNPVPLYSPWFAAYYIMRFS